MNSKNFLSVNFTAKFELFSVYTVETLVLRGFNLNPTEGA